MATRARTIRPRLLLHPPFVSMGGTLLIAAFVTDWQYSNTALFQWANFSAWLITGGLVLALVATVLLGVDLLIGNAGRIRWLSFILLAAAAVISIFNVLVHSRDAWTSVVPTGFILSAIAAILLLVVAFLGWSVTDGRARVEEDRV
jgi:uncharacterized membrane protein